MARVTPFWTAVALLLTCHLQAVRMELMSPLEEVRYLPAQPLVMNMSSSREVAVMLTINKTAIPTSGADTVSITFATRTVSPQFNILSLDHQTAEFITPRRQLEKDQFQLQVKPKLHANYIGHAILQPISVQFFGSNRELSRKIMVPVGAHQLPVTIVQYEGVWGVIFIVSVSTLILISYINLGAQLDEDNLRSTIRQPKSLILGTIISVVVMPLIAWLVGFWFLQGQPMFRLGAFIFAIGPTASASTLWTAMFDSDKELSVGLQVISTVSALFTMPLFLYLMEESLDLSSEVQHGIKVPYSRLASTLLGLLVALAVGWRLGRHKGAAEVSRKIFKPLVFFVLIFIIVFSSILYWHIYQMFDWNITLASLITTLATYLVSALLGYCIDCDLDRGIAISITSTYKNSGIAFAVLLVAFDPPDTYIAYVPCLTQVVTTSLTLYLTYTIVKLVNLCRRLGQPNSIQATPGDEVSSAKRRKLSAEEEGEEDDEFIAMNVTDVPAALQADRQKGDVQSNEAQGPVTVKVVGGKSKDDDDDDNENKRSA